MILYAESSAVLSWLLGERAGGAVAALLGEADDVVSSDLTLVECDRCFHRAVATGLLPEATALDRRAVLSRAAATWHLLRLEPEVLERARRTFPAEPVPTLDALHLSLALRARSAAADLELLSLDDRVRTNAALLGLPVAPTDRG